MELLDVRIAHYRSVENSGVFPVEPDVTCLVGKNESGKTALLQALRRLNPLEDVKFVVTEDYPRRYLQKYKERHAQAPIVVRARFSLSPDEVREIDEAFGPGLCTPTHPEQQPTVPVVEVSRDYDNKLRVDIKVDEEAFVQHLVAGIPDLDPRAREVAKTAKTLKRLQDGLAALPDQGPSIQALLQKATEHSKSRPSIQVWETCLKKHFPKLMYFDDYSIMHGAASLDHLMTPAARADARLLPLLDLLTLADATPQALKEQTNYEEHKARLEGTANYITDEVFEYWKQNQDLEVEFDVGCHL